MWLLLVSLRDLELLWLKAGEMGLCGGGGLLLLLLGVGGAHAPNSAGCGGNSPDARCARKDIGSPAAMRAAAV